jgi:hypothetical protein
MMVVAGVSAASFAANTRIVGSKAVDPVMMIGFGSVASLHIWAFACAATSRLAAAATPPAARRIRRFMLVSIRIVGGACVRQHR